MQILTQYILRCSGTAALLLLCLWSTYGQELNFEVTVVAPNVQVADPEIFKLIERDVANFINNTKWTGKTYEPNEKIEGSIQFTITKDLAAAFTADFIIKAVRPVYNASYTTPLINHVDKGISFGYQPNQDIERSEQTYTDNLSSILTFYVYMVLALDADSFELYGGTDYYNTALAVMANLPSGLATSDPGWDPSKVSNRATFIESALNPRLKPFRQAYYEYHRQGLDKMTEDRGRARAVIASNITQIADVNQSFPYAQALKIFAYAKREELSTLFEVAPKGQKRKVYNTFVAIDPILAEALKKLND